MTTTIRVTPFAVDVNGAEEEYGEEIGTYGWYIVADALEKYLGRENMRVDWNYEEYFFTINIDDEGCDHRYDFTQILETIHEPFPRSNPIHGGHHRIFRI